MGHLGQVMLLEPSTVDTDELYEYIDLLVDAIERAETELKSRGEERATPEPILVDAQLQLLP